MNLSLPIIFYRFPSRRKKTKYKIENTKKSFKEKEAECAKKLWFQNVHEKRVPVDSRRISKENGENRTYW